MDDLTARVAAFLDGGPGLWLAPGTGEPPEGCVVVATSGSTGGAKPVVLSRAALRAAADAARERLGWAATWHLALPAHYVAGLMVVVRGVLGDGVRRAAADLTGLDPAPGRNAISVVATQLYRCAQAGSGALASLARFDAVLVGGSALGAGVRAAAEAGGVRVIETYGMSETCGGVVWDGAPLPGVDVRLAPDGRVSIAGPMRFDGYLGDPERTAAALVDGAVVTQDRGRWAGGRLVIDGRLDDVVISGGVNVDLAQVRRAAAALEPESAVLAVDDPEWGARVVLFAPAGTLDAWRERLRGTLPDAALPRQVVHVASIPRTAGGKPDRQSLLRCIQQ